MRAAAARSGVASTVHYDDRDRLLRETMDERANEAIWKFSPRKLLSAAEVKATKAIPADKINPGGEVCFRIRRPFGWSIGYKMSKAVVAANGAVIEDAVFRLIEFKEAFGGQYGEFITADTEQIERLRRDDALMKGVVEWDKINAEHLAQEGEEAAGKLMDPAFTRALFAGARKLGLNLEETFASVLKPKQQQQEKQEQADA